MVEVLVDVVPKALRKVNCTAMLFYFKASLKCSTKEFSVGKSGFLFGFIFVVLFDLLLLFGLVPENLPDTALPFCMQATIRMLLQGKSKSLITTSSKKVA